MGGWGLGASQPELTCGFEQREGTEDIGLDKVSWALNAAINVRLGGKMDHSVNLLIGKQLLKQRLITDIGMHETVIGVILNILKVGRVTGVGQFVKVDDPCIGQPFENKTDKIRTNKSTTTGNKYVLH